MPDRGQLAELAAVRSMAATREHRNQASQRFDQEQERKKQRELRQSSFLGTAAAATRDAFEASTRREKTLIEEVHEWGVEYRNTKPPPASVIVPPACGDARRASVQKRLQLPRRNTMQQEMPQWFQENAANMTDWFQLRRLLNAAEPVNLFQRSESGNLTRFKVPQGFSPVHGSPTESRSLTKEQIEAGLSKEAMPSWYRQSCARKQSPIPSPGDRRLGVRFGGVVEAGAGHEGRAHASSPTLSPIIKKQQDNSAAQDKKMDDWDKEFVAMQDFQAAKALPKSGRFSPTRYSPTRTLVSGSLVRPADTLLAAQSPLRHPALPPTGSLDSTFEEQTGKAIPFAIETESQDMQKDPSPVLCTAPDRNNYKFYNHPDQFAWWSRHWAALTADKRDTEKSLCTGEQDRLDMTVAGKPARYVPKPIKPVDNFWKGNFQKRPVPWRREQLGAFPTYKDFPWPPQDPSHTDALRQEHARRYLERSQPWGDDRKVFRGPSETSMFKLVYPPDRYTRQCPDFSDKRSDVAFIPAGTTKRNKEQGRQGRETLSASRNSFTTLPEGKAWRPRSVVGWAGYRQTRDDEAYDPFSRRLFANAVDKMLSITADKMVEFGVPASAGNFGLAFSHFEPQPKRGKVTRAQFHAILYHFGAVFSEKDEEDYFQVFATTDNDGQRMVDYHTWADALDERGLVHPLEAMPDKVFFNMDKIEHQKKYRGWILDGPDDPKISEY